VSARGARSSGDGGRALADELDRAGIEWCEVVTDPDSNAGRDAVADALAAVPADRSIAIVAIGAAADGAVDTASSDPRIAIAVVVAGRLGEESCHLLSAWKDVPIVVVADASEPGTLEPAVRIFRSATHPDSDLEIVSRLDIGDQSFGGDQWATIATSTVERIRGALASVGVRHDVVVRTSDGWEIHGTLTVPERDEPVPAAVLLHSGRSDRGVFARLVSLLTRLGVATLNVDWRGRGLSQNLATYFELTSDARADAWRDARAAVDFLATQPLVDASRVAMVGVVHGAEHAVAASIDDRRVRMLGILTGYVPRNERERAYLVSGDVEAWYVSCAGHGPVTAAMRDLVDATPAGRATMRVYPGGAIGYQLFDIDPRLEDELARWVADGLSAPEPATPGAPR
jgi:dienelactone hydrolase